MNEQNSLDNAKALGITLKNVKTFEGHDTMMGFNADVYVDGVLALHAFDSAHGGCYEYRSVKGQMPKDAYAIQEKLEAKLKELPEYEFQFGKGEPRMMRDNLDMVIGALVNEHLNKKEFKKHEKKGIVLETPSGDYSIVNWNGTLPNLIKKHGDRFIDAVQKAYDREVANGEKVLNLEYLKSIGIKV